MPLNKIDKISPSRTLAIWHIQENEMELLNTIKTDFNNEILLSIKAPNKRLEWLASRTLFESIAPQINIEFKGLDKNVNGKPLLVGSNFEISITHSFPYVAAIIDTKSEVGIDLEQPKDKIIKIASKFCTGSELDYSNMDSTILCIIWSAKEALYKIYSKKGLIFNEHLFVHPFKLFSSGTIDATIAINDYQKKVILQYIVESDYVLVYNLN